MCITWGSKVASLVCKCIICVVYYGVTNWSSCANNEEENFHFSIFRLITAGSYCVLIPIHLNLFLFPLIPQKVMKYAGDGYSTPTEMILASTTRLECALSIINNPAEGRRTLKPTAGSVLSLFLERGGLECENEETGRMNQNN